MRRRGPQLLGAHRLITDCRLESKRFCAASCSQPIQAETIGQLEIAHEASEFLYSSQGPYRFSSLINGKHLWCRVSTELFRVVCGDAMVLRVVLLIFISAAYASSGFAQNGSYRERMMAAADQACVLATHIKQLCNAGTSPRTQRSLQMLIGAVCKADRAVKRIDIEKRMSATYGTASDHKSCLARADAFERVSAEMRSMGIAAKKQRASVSSPGKLGSSDSQS